MSFTFPFSPRLVNSSSTLLQTSVGSGSTRDFHFYLDKGNSFHTPTYFEFSVPYDNPDLYGDFLLEAVMERFPVMGVSGASSKWVAKYYVLQKDLDLVRTSMSCIICIAADGC